MSSTTPGFNLTTLNDSSTPETTTASPSGPIPDFWIGLMLAVGSSFFIGSSFILQKLGLRSAGEKEGATKASEGGHKYLLEWKWWIGMILMILGEACNFVAFAFAPATLVTPLGALSVIFSAILASYFLKERLNLLGKLGCLLCILGSTIMVIHSPKSAEIQHMEELLDKIKQPGILTLVGVFIVAAAIAIIFFAPRWGQTNVVVYVFICSTLGALTVTGCKGVGVALKQTFEGDQQFTNWLTYVMMGVVIVDILFQLHFLNKALDTFNTAVVTPTYYVMFTSAVTVCSLVLFQEFDQMTVENIIGDLAGFLVIVSGIFLLNVFKDMDITLKNIPDSRKTDVTIEITEGTELPPAIKDSSIVMEVNENDGEGDQPGARRPDNTDSNQGDGDNTPAQVNPAYSNETLDQDSSKTPNVFFTNGHVEHLDTTEAKYIPTEEVTHF